MSNPVSSSFSFMSPDVDRVDLSARISSLENTAVIFTPFTVQTEPGSGYNPFPVQVIDATLLLGNQLLCGFGAPTYFLIAPHENKTKTLYFSNDPIGSNCYFSLNLENRSGLTGVKDPVEESDAANKRYVDSHIVSSANQITLTPSGNISATNVQAAIQELDQEKAPVSNTVTLDTAQVIKSTKTFGQYIRASWGGPWCRFYPDDNIAKTLYFKNTDVGANCYFNLDLERSSGLTGLKDPVNDYDAATKKYVDEKLSPFYAAAKSRPKLIQKLTTFLGLLGQIPESRLETAIKALESLASSETNSSNPNFSNNT